MTRYLLALSACVALAGAGTAKEVSIKWHGQSFFEIKTSAGTVIAIDPHDLEAYGKREVKADLVLITHFHIDHANLAQITNPRAKIITGLKNKDVKVVDVSEGRGLVIGNRKNDEFANVNETFKDVKIKSLGSYHDDVEGMRRGKNSIFILEFDGLRIVHLGDLGHTLTPSLAKKVGTPDVLMIPIGGTYTINGSDAKEVVKQLKPRRYIIPTHYGTKVYDYLLGPDEFLEDQDEKLIKRFKHNELTIDPEAVPRKNPLIALLNYE